MARPLVVAVSLDAISHNYRQAKALHPTSKAFAVLKANAYGHGAVRVAQALEPIADAFAVAAIEEARELRCAGVIRPIMLLEGVFEAIEWQECETSAYWCALDNKAQLDSFLASDVQIEKIFLKVDTGMHRLGVSPADALQYVTALRETGRVAEVLLMSHFACADELGSPVTHEQLALFEQARASIGDISTSVANSAAILKWPLPDGGWIRPGIMLYGISPFADISSAELGLQAAMSFTSKVISLRAVPQGDKVGYAQSYVAPADEVIATIAVGYGDGYPRHAEQGTPVLINGVVCPLVGRVSMDMITVNVTALPQVAIGDSVELWGPTIKVEEVAQWATTIGYEVVTRMTARPRLVYL